MIKIRTGLEEVFNRKTLYVKSPFKTSYSSKEATVANVNI